jgi:Na+/phosphate symporter
MDKEVEEKLILVCRSEIKMLGLIFVSFRTLTGKSIEEAEQMKEEVRRHSAELAKFVIARSSLNERGKEGAKPYLSMSSSFDRIGYNMEGMLTQLKAMVKDHNHFSDHAIKEVNDIFQEAMDLLERLPDLIQTKNKLFAQQIGEQVRAILKIANGHSEDHEERLIQGVCMPKSSPIYLGLIESLKGIITHILEVSGKIVSLSAKA